MKTNYYSEEPKNILVKYNQDLYNQEYLLTCFNNYDKSCYKAKLWEYLPSNNNKVFIKQNES